MANSFRNLPAAAKDIEPFTVSVPEEDLYAFKTLLSHSRLATPTYESSQEDRTYGVTSSWMANAKDHWMNRFDWYVCLKFHHMLLFERAPVANAIILPAASITTLEVLVV